MSCFTCVFRHSVPSGVIVGQTHFFNGSHVDLYIIKLDAVPRGAVVIYNHVFKSLPVAQAVIAIIERYFKVSPPISQHLATKSNNGGE